ncbi:DUF1294 domain-containing protein [Sulfurimonas sp.]|uniref:DUF1294 domain-containing protein n=1 Tax=Sulfurimonas sp. TaxID=2022749 RepID=UPI0025FA20D5|nr:DUF1294 domain-containing protein [Sulfurimonas sp.]
MIYFSFALSYFQIYLIFINSISFLLYAYDKLLSLNIHKKPQRISENKLLISTLLGGTVGSVLAMFTFRHKIKKTSFIIKTPIPTTSAIST